MKKNDGYLHEAKMCRQRAIQGYCDDDLRDIGAWLSRVVPDMLEDYLAQSNWTPMSADVKDRADFEHAIQQIADDIRYAGLPAKEDNPYQEEYDNVVRDDHIPTMQEEIEVIEKWAQANEELMMDKINRLKRGLEGLAKWYWDLWF